jgi:hypothetical protein
LRSNAPKERRLVYGAIEAITSTKTARLSGMGAQFYQIRDYTKLKRVIVDAALKMMATNGIIECRDLRWHLKGDLPENWCWEHGHGKPGFLSKCKRCEEKYMIVKERKLR